jgi:release factor glutamine methyltransferase
VDGLEAYREIVAGAPLRLREGGRLVVEIGPAQGAAVSALMAAAGLAPVHVVTDLDGRDRVVVGRRHGPDGAAQGPQGAKDGP